MRDSYYLFKSSQFKLDANEDKMTKPGCFGKALAHWLAEQLAQHDYHVEIVPEDWGWCVICCRDEYLLWVGCGNELTNEVLHSSSDRLPSHENIIWRVFTEIEVPFYMVRSMFKKWFGRLDTDTPFERLASILNKILLANRSIEFIERPDF